MRNFLPRPEERTPVGDASPLTDHDQRFDVRDLQQFRPVGVLLDRRDREARRATNRRESRRGTDRAAASGKSCQPFPVEARAAVTPAMHTSTVPPAAPPSDELNFIE